MVTNIKLPIPGDSSNTWGDVLNAAITAVRDAADSISPLEVVVRVVADYSNGGGTDVTDAINAYFTNAREVVIPAGNYRIAGSIVVPAGKTLRLAPGATLHATGAAGRGNMMQVGGGATLLGPGTLHGHGLPTYLATPTGNEATFRGVTFNTSYLYGIGNSSYTDLTIDDCTFIDIPDYVLLNELIAASRPMFVNNRITNATNGKGPLFKNGVVNGVIANNIINVKGTTAIENIGECIGTTIIGNTVTANQIGISIDFAMDTVISGNVVTDAGYANIEVAQASKGCLVSGNSVTGGGIGIVETQQNGIWSQQNTYIGNTIKNTSGHGMRIWGSRCPSISGNTFSNCATRYISLESTYCATVTGNSIRVSGGGKAGINTIDCNSSTISSNAIDCSDSPAGNDGISALNCSNMTYTGNSIRQPLIGIRIAGGNGHLLGSNHVVLSGDRSITSDAPRTLVVGHMYTINSGSGEIILGGANSGVRDSMNTTGLIG